MGGIILFMMGSEMLGGQPEQFSIASQAPIFVPVYGVVCFTSDSAEFVSTGD